jgi:hypothetical protein
MLLATIKNSLILILDFIPIKGKPTDGAEIIVMYRIIPKKNNYNLSVNKKKYLYAHLMKS